MQVKSVSMVMRGNASANTGVTPRPVDGSSFEEVFSSQTEKNSSSGVPADDGRAIQKEETPVKDSIKTKDANRIVKKADGNDGELKSDTLEDMTPEEWEKAMEVLGAVAVDIMQQVADVFDLTAEEVQNLMNDLGLEQLDLLQQEGLGELMLAAAGAEDVTALLTDEGLYQKYQTIIEQLDTALENNGNTLQLVQLMDEPLNDLMDKPLSDSMDAVEENSSGNDGMTVIISKDSLEDAVHNQAMKDNRDTGSEEQTGTQAQEKNVNPLLQNLSVDNVETQLQPFSEAVSSWDEETIDIMKQIMDSMKIQLKPDMTDLEMQLHPENLGTLQIHVASKGGSVTAQFVTQNEAVKAALESQMIQLKENFAEQGVKVDSIEVTVQTHQFEQNLEQGRGRQPEESERRARPRRIRLDGAINMDELLDMEEKEKLAVQIMEANGSTVDYTA